MNGLTAPARLTDDDARRVPMREFGKVLRAARQLRGFTRGVLAAAAELPDSRVLAFESGKRAPTHGELRRLWRVLGRDATEVMQAAARRRPRGATLEQPKAES